MAGALALDAPLPKMPLWIMEERCVPVDLEAAYTRRGGGS